jgi:hypothetical protein
MLMDQQNEYCENGYTTKSNLFVQCNSHQNSNDILHRDRKINPKGHMKSQKTPIAKDFLSKKGDAGNITVSDFKLYYRAIIIKAARY